MATRTGKVILARDINLDKSYNNVVNYTEQQMLNLVNANKVIGFENCSFVRQGENTIKLGSSYGTIIQANYLAFQNPDYSNKWFFAFITGVEYVSDSDIRVSFQVDEFSTWFDYWTANTCWVLREHTNNDTVGNNTQPENLELGEYVLNGAIKNNCYVPDGAQDPTAQTNMMYICFQVSDFPDGAGEITPSLGDDVKGTRINGVYTGLTYLFLLDSEQANRLIRCYDKANKADSIVAIFQVPLGILNSTAVTFTTYTNLANETMYIGTIETDNYTPIEINNLSITKPVTLDSYSPVNNKMLTYPFCYFYVSNNAGAEVTYHFEDFNGNPNFKTDCAISQGMSIKSYPTNYKRGSNKDGFNFGITGGKLPICAWNSDYYTNWCTQNAVNTILQPIGAFTGGLMGMASSTMAGSPLGVVSSGMSAITGVAQALNRQYVASMTPDQARGNSNCGDVNTAEIRFGYTFYPMSIKSEYARRIDQFFTRFGYKTNLLKVPNITGRRYWNFVQITDGEDIVKSNQTISVPADSIETINGIFRKGVTIWHDHANIGNFGLSNTIVS